jgi:hypothetical protein
VFEYVIKQLLQGVFICEVSHDEAFHYLKNPDKLQAVEAFLAQIGYRLATTQNQLAFYAAYQQIDSTNQGDIKRIFQQFRLELHPVLEWLDMMMSCLHQDSALAPGDTLSFSSLLQVIEQNQALADRLLSFTKFKDFAGNDDSIKARLEKLLGTLHKWGYLKQANRDLLIYQVTGKLDYFYQALQFIQEHEQIPIDQAEEDSIQEHLF